MKKKDLHKLQTVCAIYPLCYGLNKLLEQYKSYLPESVHADVLLHNLSVCIGDMEIYRDENRDIFINACEDAEGRETMKLWKAKVTKCQSDIEGKCCLSQKEVERIFDDFDDAIVFINSTDDFWTANVNPHIWEYEVSSCRELKRVTREREETIKHKETSWE